MNSLLAAIRFLTIIPVPGNRGTDQKHLAPSLFWFPVVGTLIGGVLGGIFVFLTALIPLQQITALLAVLALLSASGGLHLDGVADCADGFFSSRPRARILEIMKDSRIGAMGVIALVFVILLKAAAFNSLPAGYLWKAVVLMPITGRCAILIMMALLPYARPEGGLGSLFYKKSNRFYAVWGLAFMFGAGWLVAAKQGLVISAAALILALAFSWYCKRKIGGATGDTLGAVCELTETVTAIAFAAISIFEF